MIEIISLDSRTLLSVMVWINFILVVLIFLFRSVNKDTYNNEPINRMLITRLLQAGAGFLLFMRVYFIDLVSVNIGNSLSFTSFYFEACLLLTLSETKNIKLHSYVKRITIISVIIFNALEITLKQPSLRVISASCIIMIIFVIPTFVLIFEKPVILYKRIMGLFYLFLILLLIPRAVVQFLDTEMDILTNNIIQTLTYLSMLLIFVSSTVVLLFITKNDADKKYRKMATTDYLTGISNRFGFMKEASTYFSFCKSNRKNITFLFFDIDHLKMANDKYGHAFGDVVIRRCAEIINNNLRSHDLVCRYGGEEFIAVLSEDEPELGSIISNRIMSEIRKTLFEDHPDFKLTISIGIFSGIPKSETLGDFIDKCDKALYEAKNTGRDKIIHYNSLLCQTIERGYYAGKTSP